MKTVIGMFDSATDAQSIASEFTRLGLPLSQIGSVSPEGRGGAGARLLELPDVGRVSADGLLLKLLDESTLKGNTEGIFGALLRMGVSKSDASRCMASLKGGNVLEAVIVEDNKEADARALMQGRLAAAAGPERATPANETETAHAVATRQAETDRVVGAPQTLDAVIPVIKEELRVGKREVLTGGVRVSTRVATEPVEKTVTIREERVIVERRVLDRPVEERDDGYRDRSLEFTAMNDEPVVVKHARVVEEIRVHKDTTERVEKIQDSLRHTNVDIADIPRNSGASRQQGVVNPAYEFGRQLRARMPGRTWSELEAQTKARWEATNPDTWSTYSGAIRAGWETQS